MVLTSETLNIVNLVLLAIGALFVVVFIIIEIEDRQARKKWREVEKHVEAKRIMHKLEAARKDREAS